MVSKIRSRKVDQSAKPGIATVYRLYMSVAISWAKKVQSAKYDIRLVLQNPVTFYVFYNT